MMCWSHMLHPWNCFEHCALLESKLDNDGLNKPKCVNTMFILTNQRIFLGSGVVTYKYNQYWLNKIITNFAHFWTKTVQFHYLTKNFLKFKKIWDFSQKKLFVVSILNLIYHRLCDFACDVNSEYIKTIRMCIILR